MTNPVAILKQVNWTNPNTKEVVPAYKKVVVFCPGCKQHHDFTVEILDPDYKRQNGNPEPTWDWDGNLEKPTFNPSMLAYSTVHLCEDEHPPTPCPDYENCDQKGHLIMNYYEAEQKDWVYGHSSPHTREPWHGNCHSFLHDGIWQFLADSAHSLAGKNVPVVPLPNRYVK